MAKTIPDITGTILLGSWFPTTPRPIRSASVVFRFTPVRLALTFVSIPRYDKFIDQYWLEFLFGVKYNNPRNCTDERKFGKSCSVQNGSIFPGQVLSFVPLCFKA